MLRRSFSTWRPPTFSPLPPVPTWRTVFGSPRERTWLHSPETAAAVAEGFLKSAKSPKTIVEAYPGERHHDGAARLLKLRPGAGVLTRAILHYPPSVVQKVIVLEDDEKCLPMLKVGLTRRP